MSIKSNRTPVFLIICICFVWSFALINGSTDQTKAFNINDFVHNSSEHAKLTDRETYLKHPCRRECIDGAPAKVCNYTFSVSNENFQKITFFSCYFKNLCF